MTSFRRSEPQICVGDILVSVDGTKASGLPPSQLVRMLRGAAGTHVSLGLRRPAGPSDPGAHYIIDLVRGLDRPVSQRAFGRPEHRDSQGMATRTSGGFLVS